MLRRQGLVTGEKLGEMLVHGAHVARSDGRRALQFRATADEPVDRTLERYLASCPKERPGTFRELVDRFSAIGNDQRNAAGACLRRDQAERLRLTAVNQSVGAGEQLSELVTV